MRLAVCSHSNGAAFTGCCCNTAIRSTKRSGAVRSALLAFTWGSHRCCWGCCCWVDRPAQTGAVDRVFPVFGVNPLFLYVAALGPVGCCVSALSIKSWFIRR